MAVEGGAAAETRPGQSSVDPEKAQVEDEAGRQQPEREGHQETERRPAVPVTETHSTPLPPPHQEAKGLLPPPPQNQLSGVHFAPLPPPLPPRPEPQPITYERPYYPVWHMAKLALGTLSLISSAIIIGLGIALGLYVAPFISSPEAYQYGIGGSRVDIEVGVSATAAGLAIAVTAVEFLKIAVTGRTMLPGAHVAFQLFIWLVAVSAVIISSLYVTDWGYYDEYDYPHDDPSFGLQSSIYETVILGFCCVLVFIHFILFCGACAEAHALNRAKRGTIVVEVPVPVPAGTPIPEGHLPYYMRPQSFVPQPGAQQVQYAVPMVPQTAQQSPGGGLVAGQAQHTATYGGYYAPGPPNMWASPPQQQQGNAQQFQGYYAPAPALVMTSSNSARREPPAPAPASSSGSRRSQRLAQAQAQPNESQETQEQVQARQTEPSSEKTA